MSQAYKLSKKNKNLNTCFKALRTLKKYLHLTYARNLAKGIQNCWNKGHVLPAGFKGSMNRILKHLKDKRSKLLNWRLNNSKGVPYSRISSKKVLNKKCKYCGSTMRAKRGCLCCGSPCDCTLYFKCNNRKCGAEYIRECGDWWFWGVSKITYKELE